MKLEEVTVKIKEIDPAFSVQKNLNREGLANIFYNGINYDLPAISSIDVPEEPNPSATYTFPGGMVSRLWAWPEIEARLIDFVALAKSGKLDELYGR